MTTPTAEAEYDFDALGDSIPSGMADIEYPCSVCGREVGYSGRGRKPNENSKCADCKPSRKAATARTGGKVTGANAAVAAQATEVLSQFNSLGALILMSLGLPNSAKSVQLADSGFREAAYNALLTDKEFAAFIARGGVQSAKVGLALAYATFGMAVAPTVMMELKMKREAEQEG